MLRDAEEFLKTGLKNALKIILCTGELATLKLFRSGSNHKGLKLAQFEGFKLSLLVPKFARICQAISLKPSNSAGLSPL